MKQKEKISPSPSGTKKATEAATKPRRFSQDFSAGGRTQQNFKASCDVNIIVAHYAKTGLDPHADRLGKQKFGYATSRDFSEAMQATAEIESAFADLPSAERAHFENSPAAWLDHITALAPPEAETPPPDVPPTVETPSTPTPTPPETPSADS